MTSLTELIAPAFYGVHNAIKQEKYTHYWLKGGRGSTKSSFISIELILGIMKNPQANAVCIRKVGVYLKDSVYEQLLWAIDKLGVTQYWDAKKSPLELVFIPTGQRILFRGADNPKKLKSTKVSKGYIRYIWYEEADEFSGPAEIRTINQSLMRGGDKFDVFYSYNPPKSQRNWVNDEAHRQDADKLIFHSTYLDVPPQWLGEQFMLEAQHLKKCNEQAYRHEYLGEVVGNGTEVFQSLEIREIKKEEIDRLDTVCRGIDWGYATDPFVYVAVAYSRKYRKIFIFHEYYKVGARYDAIASEILKENPRGMPITAESAEPRSNDELRERGLHIRPAKKGPGSIEHGISWLQNLESIVIDPVRCPNATREFTGYELEVDEFGNTKAGFPDKNNHTIDAVRYALEQFMRKPSVSF